MCMRGGDEQRGRTRGTEKIRGEAAKTNTKKDEQDWCEKKVAADLITAVENMRYCVSDNVMYFRSGLNTWRAVIKISEISSVSLKEAKYSSELHTWVPMCN